jgi:DNA invertase Pin-like site-specific DNA recombinase
MSQIYGYARPTVSLPEPHAHGDQLAEAGADRIFVERNGAQARRAMRERRRLLDYITPGDTLILLSLEHLGTSFDDMLRCFEILVERGVNVKVLDAGFETAGPDVAAHQALLKLLGGARSALRSEAIKLSLAEARAKGGKPAGKAAILTPEQWPDIKARIDGVPLETVAEELGVSRQTLWTYRRRMTELSKAAAS